MSVDNVNHQREVFTQPATVQRQNDKETEVALQRLEGIQTKSLPAKPIQDFHISTTPPPAAGKLQHVVTKTLHSNDATNELVHAIKSGSATKQLIEKMALLGANLSEQVQDDMSLLMYAVASQKFAAAFALIEHLPKYELDRQDSKGNNALMLAAKIGNKALVEALLSRGANPNILNNYGMSAGDCAIKEQNSEVAKLLIQNSNGYHQVWTEQRLLAHRFALNNTVQIGERKIELEGCFFQITIPELHNSLSTFFAVPEAHGVASWQPDDSLAVLSALQSSLLPVDDIAGRVNGGDLAAFCSGWKGHGAAVVISGNLLFKCNRGDLAGVKPGIEIFKIGQLHNVEKALKCLDEAKSMQDPLQGMISFVGEIDDILGLESIGFIAHKDQHSGNCSWASAKLMVQALVYAQLLKNGSSHEEAMRESKKLYKNFTNFDRLQALQSFEKNPYHSSQAPQELAKEGIIKREVLSSIYEKSLNERYSPIKAYLDQIGAAPSAEDGLTPLHQACIDGDIGKVTALIQAGVDKETKTKRQNVALHYAVLGGNLAVVRALVEAGSLFIAGSKNKVSPLELAADQGQAEIVDYLLSRVHADQAVQMSQVQKEILIKQVVLRAVKSGRYELAHTLVQKYSDKPPAFYYLDAGLTEPFKEYLSRGADVNILDKDGNSLLARAVKSGSLAFIKAIVENNPQKAVEAVELALKINQHLGYEVIRQGLNQTPLHYFAKTGQESPLRRYLSDPTCRIDQRDGLRRTALHYAIELGREDLVNILLENEADITISDKRNKSVLSYAAESGNLELFKLLVAKCEDSDQYWLTARDFDGKTPLNYAVLSGNLEIVQAFIHSDYECESIVLDILKTNRPLALEILSKFSSTTPLQLFAKHGKFEELKALLESQPCDLSTPDSNGKTPLMLAIDSANADVVTHLLAQGASIRGQDHNGLTAFAHAAMSGNNAICALLFAHRADCLTPDNEGKTPIMHAAEAGHSEVVLSLLTSPLGRYFNWLQVMTCAVDHSQKETAEQITQQLFGMPPLQYFVWQGDLEWVTWLLDADIDPNKQNSLDGATALHLAVAQENLDLVEVLLAKNADPLLGDARGVTVLEIAKNTANQEIIQLLQKKLNAQ